jgi:DNA-binding NtrC family response regulator
MMTNMNSLQRILVVDDEAPIRELCSEVLIGNGFEVDTAGDGADGWKAIQLKNYDLLITDNVMPKLSGIELLAKIYDARLTLPAIMVTGTPPLVNFDREPTLRPAVVLLKPFSFGQLLEVVNKILLPNQVAVA